MLDKKAGTADEDEELMEILDLMGEDTQCLRLLMNPVCTLERGINHVNMPSLARAQKFTHTKIVKLLVRLPRSYYFGADPAKIQK